MSSSAVDYGDEEAPLLRKRHVWLKTPEYPSINLQHWYSYPFRGEGLTVQNSREKTARFLSSKAGHYSVLGLVTLDVLGIIAGEKCYRVQAHENSKADFQQISFLTCSNANEAEKAPSGTLL